MSLRTALDAFAAGWRDDLSPAWQSALAGASPDPLAVEATLPFTPKLPIYPGRRGKALPDAQPDAHVFRAFDGVEPSQVRCVVIGQDPYPKLSQATGRSFEQGDLGAWPAGASAAATSLRSLVKMLLAARVGDPAVLEMTWANYVKFAATVPLEQPRDLFDHLQAQGTLWLNAGLTITRFERGGAPEQKRGHLPFWRPVVGQVLRALAVRPAGHVVFLCLGQFAQKLLVAERVAQVADAAGTWEKRASAIALLHPATPGFMRGPNPFVEVNRRLATFSAAPIAW